MTREVPLATPGEILAEEFLKPMGLTEYALAKAIGVSGIRINQIVKGRRAITTDTALRLSTYFGTDDQFWVNLQTNYDLKTHREAIADTLAKIQPVQIAA